MVTRAASACYGRDASQFPSNNFFGAVGEGLWDNGAACGRQYQVRCISAAVRRTCIPGQMIQIKIVDRAQSSVSRPSLAGTTLVLSSRAFQVIANASAPFINVEYQQWVLFYLFIAGISLFSIAFRVGFVSWRRF